MWRGTILLIAYFLGNTCAKHENPTKMLSRVPVKNVRGAFLRHSLDVNV